MRFKAQNAREAQVMDNNVQEVTCYWNSFIFLAARYDMLSYICLSYNLFLLIRIYFIEHLDRHGNMRNFENILRISPRLRFEKGIICVEIL